MNEIYRTIHVSKNHAFCDVAAFALQQANNSLVPVAFRFYAGVSVTMPGHSLDAVLAAWSDDYDSHMLLVGSIGA